MISEAALAARRKNISIARAFQARMPRTALQLKTLSENGRRTIAQARAIAASRPLTKKQLKALSLGRKAKRTELQAEAGRKSLAKARTYQRWVWTKIERDFFSNHLRPLCRRLKLKVHNHQKMASFLTGDQKVPRSLHGYRDFIIPEIKTVIEVDGCYWHGCGRCYAGHNKANKLRDRRVDHSLKSIGWRIIRVKEHSLTRHFKFSLS